MSKTHHHPKKRGKANPCFHKAEYGDVFTLVKGETTVEVSFQYPEWRREKDHSRFTEEEREIQVLLAQGYKFLTESSGGESSTKKGKKNKNFSPLVNKALNFNAFEPNKRIVYLDTRRTVTALMSLIGKFSDREVVRPRINIGGLIVALEGVDDPTDYLEVPTPIRPRTKILFTVDQSGSCLGFANVFHQWVQEISKKVKGKPIDILALENINGNFFGLSEKEENSLISEFDLVVYCGDFDCIQANLHKRIKKDAALVVLANVSHRVQNVSLENTLSSQSCLVFKAVTPESDEDTAYCIEYAVSHFS